MDRFHPADAEQVYARAKRTGSIDRAVAAIRHDNMVAGIEEFRNTGDRELLADILLAIVRKPGS